MAKKPIINTFAQEAQIAINEEDWQTALEKIQHILYLDSTHAQAKDLLHQVLTLLYDQGRKHYEAGRWREALACFRQIQKIGGNYKHTNAVIANIEKRLDSSNLSSGVVSLYQEAQIALHQADWETAIGKLNAILAQEPDQAKATAMLNQAKKQQTLMTLYAKGQERYRSGRLYAALAAFRQVQQLDNHYKRVNTIIGVIEKEIARQESIKRPQQTATSTHPRRLLALSVTVLLILLLCGGGYLLLGSAIRADITKLIMGIVPTPTETQMAPMLNTPNEATFTPVSTALLPPAYTPTPIPPLEEDVIIGPTATAIPIPTQTSFPTNTPLPAVPTPTPSPIISFQPEFATINQGQCITLQWQINYVQAAFLNGGEFNNLLVSGPFGSRNVCPTSNTNYTLHVILFDNRAVLHTSVITVITQPTITPPPPPTATSISTFTPTATPTPTFTYGPPTVTPSDIPTTTPTDTPEPTYTATLTSTPTYTPTPTPTLGGPTVTTEPPIIITPPVINPP